MSLQLYAKLRLQLKRLEDKICSRFSALSPTDNVEIRLADGSALFVVVNGQTWGWEQDPDIVSHYCRLTKLIKLKEGGATDNDVIYARLQME